MLRSIKAVIAAALLSFACGSLAATTSGFSPWTRETRWYTVDNVAALATLVPATNMACAWAVAENSQHTWNGTSWTAGGPCSSGGGGAGGTVSISQTGTANDVDANCLRTDALSTVAQANGTATPCRTTSTGATWVALANSLDFTADDVTTYAAPVRATAIATGVTTNATSTLVAGTSGQTTFYGQVVCSSGACTQTQQVYGDQDDDAGTDTDGVLICTLTLSGTTVATDACPPTIAAYPFYYVVTTNTTGTAATGATYANN